MSLHNTLKTRKINESSVLLKHKDGYRILVAVKTLPIFDQNNKVAAVIEFFTEERFHKSNYHENQQLKAKLKSQTDVI
jgi:spore germination protein GerM